MADLSARHELARARAGGIGTIRHRYKGRAIVKVLCADPDRLREWARANGIPEEWMHISRSGLPHFDLWGAMAKKFERVVRCPAN